MSRDEIFEVLRQAYSELKFECSPTAEEMWKVIDVLTKEWADELS